MDDFHDYSNAVERAIAVNEPRPTVANDQERYSYIGELRYSTAKGAVMLIVLAVWIVLYVALLYATFITPRTTSIGDVSAGTVRVTTTGYVSIFDIAIVVGLGVCIFFHAKYVWRCFRGRYIVACPYCNKYDTLYRSEHNLRCQHCKNISVRRDKYLFAIKR